MAMFCDKRQDMQVFNISQQLAEAVEAILNPNSSQDKRMQATRVQSLFVCKNIPRLINMMMNLRFFIFKVCEEFKNSKGYLTNCGIYLYSNHPNFMVKHFGLQVIHHAVK